MLWRGVPRRPQFFDAAGIQALERIADTSAGDDPVGGDLRERHKDKGAFEQARVRQRQLRVVENKIVIGEDVDIDPARTPAAFLAAVAAERTLDIEDTREQIVRRKRSCNR